MLIPCFLLIFFKEILNVSLHLLFACYLVDYHTELGRVGYSFFTIVFL